MTMNQPMMTGTSARRTIATYTTYAEAQRAVDYLSDQKFPVERVAIVAEGLKLVEQVTGRLNWGRALLYGAGSGATTGLFIGLIFGLFGFVQALFPFVLYALIVGAIIGAIFGAIGYAVSGGRRDFTSMSGMQADRYVVMADTEVADQAQTLLNSLPRGGPPVTGSRA